MISQYQNRESFSLFLSLSPHCHDSVSCESMKKVYFTFADFPSKEPAEWKLEYPNFHAKAGSEHSFTFQRKCNNFPSTCSVN